MLRFVLLEHRWDGVHWDLMLEREPGGLLRTWAIDTEVVTGRDLPARPLVDHRAAYLDYEGEVSGGRGRVRRVDRGGFTPIVWSDDLVRVRFAGAQLAGLAELRRAVAGSGASGSETAGGARSPDWVFRLGNFD